MAGTSNFFRQNVIKLPVRGGNSNANKHQKSLKNSSTKIITQVINETKFLTCFL